MHVPAMRPKTAALARTAAALLVAAVAVLGSASPALAAADDDVTWTVRTAANSHGSDRSSFSYTVKPGEDIDDAMVVTNRGTDPLDLAVYAADGFTTSSGQLDLLTKDEKSTAIGVWVRAGADRVAVAPGASVEVPFTLSIPANATPGDYVGGVITSLTQASQSQGINVDRRLGIKIALRISGELAPALNIENIQLGYSGTANPFGKGAGTVTYTVHNTGNTVLSVQQSVSVSGPFGWLKVDPGAVAAPPDLLPGESWATTVPVAGVAPALRWGATVTAVGTYVEASGSKVSLPAVVASQGGWAVPWAFLVLLVVVAGLVVGAVFFQRRNRRSRKAGEDARVDKAVKEALEAKAVSAAERS